MMRSGSARGFSRPSGLPRRRLRAFTLVEALVTLVIAASLSAAAIYITSRGSAPGSEAATQAALWGGYQAQVAAEVSRQAPAGQGVLSLLEPSVLFTEGASSGNGEVSVAVSGSAAYMSALGPDGSCWVIRYDSRPGGATGTHHAVWAVVRPGVLAACDSGDAALTMRVDRVSSGEHPLGRPALLDE